jgi:hypothetical protein
MKGSTKRRVDLATRSAVGGAVAAALTVGGFLGGVTLLDAGNTAAENGQVQEGDGGTQVGGGDGNDVVGGNGNRVRKQSGDGSRGDGFASGSGGPVNGNGVQRNEDVGDGPRNAGTGRQYVGPGAGAETDDHTQRGRRIHNGSGSQDDNQTVNNYPGPKPAPPHPGTVTMDAVAPADGGRVMGTAATFTVTVKKLPTNGNRLFIVCNLQRHDPSSPDLYYARAELSEPGRQQLTLRFGGKYPDDPTLVGSTRVCFAVTAQSGAAEELARLRYLDNKQIENDPDGVPYDVSRTSLPPGTTVISKSIAVTVERAGV